jgi:hypothetical protein
MFIITEDPVKKKGAKFTEELRIEVWRPLLYILRGCKEPRTGTASIFNIIPPNQQKLRKVYIAQLHSQGKLITPRCENRKIRQEIEILKANEPAPYV